MNKSIYYLTDYPFEEMGRKCREYTANMDWEYIYQTIRCDGYACVDIRDCVDLFSHLEIDEEHALLCYVSKEYHGLYGTVAAIKGDEYAGAYIDPAFVGRFFSMKLPEKAVNPMEIVYNDGTPEGYMEAVLFSEFITNLPRSARMQRRRKVIASYPDDIMYRWDVYVSVLDLHPKIIFQGDKKSVYIFYREFAGVVLPTDSRDEIILAKYNFDKYGHIYRFDMASKKGIFKTHAQVKGKYSENRNCSLFASTEICIVKQKKTEYKIIVNAIKCNHCGDIIESTDEKEIVSCSCGRCTVEGAHRFLSRGYFEKGDYTEMAVREETIL